MTKKPNLEQQIAEDIASYACDPDGFVHYIYRWGEDDLKEHGGPYEWQRKILLQIGQHLSGKHRFDPLLLAVASGHGIGKSALVSWITDWAISTCTDTRVLITANTGDQLATKTIPEVKKWFSRSLNVHWWTTALFEIAEFRDAGTKRRNGRMRQRHDEIGLHRTWRDGNVKAETQIKLVFKLPSQVTWVDKNYVMLHMLEK